MPSLARGVLIFGLRAGEKKGRKQWNHERTPREGQGCPILSSCFQKLRADGPAWAAGLSAASAGGRDCVRPSSQNLLSWGQRSKEVRTEEESIQPAVKRSHSCEGPPPPRTPGAQKASPVDSRTGCRQHSSVTYAQRRSSWSKDDAGPHRPATRGGREVFVLPPPSATPQPTPALDEEGKSQKRPCSLSAPPHMHVHTHTHTRVHAHPTSCQSYRRAWPALKFRAPHRHETAVSK